MSFQKTLFETCLYLLGTCLLLSACAIFYRFVGCLRGGGDRWERATIGRWENRKEA